MAFKKKKPDEPAAEETPQVVKGELAEDQTPSGDQEGLNQEQAQKAAKADDTAAKLEAATRQADEYLNMAQRVQADFDNYRRRNQAVRAEAFEDGAREFIKTLLPVMDNLERALSVESQDQALRTGVDMVYKQLNETLQKRGVTVIDRLGEKFDPSLENAVLQGTAEEGEPGTVCAVLQKGYRMESGVLRHAMVKVVPE